MASAADAFAEVLAQGLLRVGSYRDNVNGVHQMSTDDVHAPGCYDGIFFFDLYWLSGDKIGSFGKRAKSTGFFWHCDEIGGFLKACHDGIYRHGGIPIPPSTDDGNLTDTYRLIFEGEELPIDQKFKDIIPTGAALTLVLSPTVWE